MRVDKKAIVSNGANPKGFGSSQSSLAPVGWDSGSATLQYFDIDDVLTNNDF